MLFIAGITVIDVFQRWFAIGLFSGTNEVVQTAFTIAIAACIPAGLIERVNLKIDIAARYFSPAQHACLELLASFCLWLFCAVLAWRMYIHADDLARERSVTLILHIPWAPFYYGVALLLTFATLVQTVIGINDLRRVLTHGKAAALKAAAAAVLGCVAVWWWVINEAMIASWVQAHVGLAVILIFVIMWLMTLVLIPITAVMAIAGLVGSVFFIGLDGALSAATSEVADFLADYSLSTLPLFLMMGSFAALAGVPEDVYSLAHLVLGRLKGGLALATIAGCAGFGALTGHSISTIATVGKVALPEMQARNYSPAFSTGVVAAGGTLGALLPPASGVIILFALISQASIGQLFVAAIGPALLAIVLYMATVLIYVRISPQSAPTNVGERIPGAMGKASARCGPATLLFGSVLGGIYFGVFTATEAAAVGAIEAFLIALLRGKLRGKSFLEVMAATTFSTAMVYGLIFGAQIFSFFVAASGVTEAWTATLSQLNWSPTAIIAMILVIYLVLGSVMESFAVMVITVPIVTPLVLHLGYDILWWGIINICVVETGLIHPPLGINVFVLKSLQPDVSVWTVYKGVFPFVIADLVKLALLVMFPAVSLWMVANMVR